MLKGSGSRTAKPLSPSAPQPVRPAPAPAPTAPASLPTLMAPVVRNTITQSNRQEPLAYHDGLLVSKRIGMWISSLTGWVTSSLFILSLVKVNGHL